MENETKIEDLEKRFSALESQLKAALQSANSVDVFGDPKPIGDKLSLEFRSKMKGYFILSWCMIGFFGVAAVGCVLASVAEPMMHVQLFFMSMFIVAMMQIVLIKLWYWLVWNHYGIIREVKRLELRIVELTEKLEK